MKAAAAIPSLLEEMLRLYALSAQGELAAKRDYDAFRERFLDQVANFHRPGQVNPLLQAWPAWWEKQAPGSVGDVAMAIAFHQLVFSSLGSLSTLYLTPTAPHAWSERDMDVAWRALCPASLAQHLSSPPGPFRFSPSSDRALSSFWDQNATRRTVKITEMMCSDVPGWGCPEQQEAWTCALLDGVRPTLSLSTDNQRQVESFRFLMTRVEVSILEDPRLPAWLSRWQAHDEVLSIWRECQTRLRGHEPPRHQPVLPRRRP